MKSNCYGMFERHLENHADMISTLKEWTPQVQELGEIFIKCIAKGNKIMVCGRNVFFGNTDF